MIQEMNKSNTDLNLIVGNVIQSQSRLTVSVVLSAKRSESIMYATKIYRRNSNIWVSKCNENWKISKYLNNSTCTIRHNNDLEVT